MYLKGKFDHDKIFDILIQYHYINKTPTLGGYYFKSQQYIFADGFIVFPNGVSKYFTEYWESRF